MTPGQHDAAMIHLRWGQRWVILDWKSGSLQQRPAASRTPIRLSLFGKHRPAIAANPFHSQILPDCSATAPNASRAAGARYTGYMDLPVRLVAIDVDGTLVPAIGQALTARVARALKTAEQAGIIVAIATGRRPAYTAPLLEGLGLRADTPLIASNGAVIRTLGGEAIDRSHLESRIARGLCGLLRPFGSLVFTFDRPGRGELVLEDLEQAQGRVALWVEANRNAIEVVKPLEDALIDGDDPIQGMAAGGVSRMRAAEEALKASPWSPCCECARTEYPARDLSILDLLPPGVSKGWALERLAARLGVRRMETMAIGDNWNDVGMLEWAGQGVIMGNAAAELKTMAKMRGWKLAPPNNEDGVAVVLEAAIAKRAAAGGSGLVGQGW
jgi:Cof subfamily protein (haloacid dehalogenase superfamily)